MPQQRVLKLADKLSQMIERWRYYQINGCNDPFYPDGVNMNLLRSRMLCCKIKISEICKENKIMLPSDYFLSIPPEVNPSYYANVSRNIIREGKE